MREPPKARVRQSACSGCTRAQSRESRRKSASRVALAAEPPLGRRVFLAQGLSIEVPRRAAVVAKALWTIAPAVMGSPDCNCSSLRRAPVGIRGTFSFDNVVDGGGCGRHWGPADIADGRGSSLTPGEKRKACRQGNPRHEYVSRRKAVKPRCASTPGRHPQDSPLLFKVAASPVFEDVELVISAQDAAMPSTKECIFIEVIDGQPRGG
jgi:hypothetical protein